MNGFTIYESHDSILIRINLYLGFKDSMKLIDDKDVKSRLSFFYNFIGISNKICIRYNMKVSKIYEYAVFRFAPATTISIL